MKQQGRDWVYELACARVSCASMFALFDSTLWVLSAGKAENVAEAKRVLLVRAKANSEAGLGVYAGPGGASAAAASESLHVSNYSY